MRGPRRARDEEVRVGRRRLAHEGAAPGPAAARKAADQQPARKEPAVAAAGGCRAAPGVSCAPPWRRRDTVFERWLPAAALLRRVPSHDLQAKRQRVPWPGSLHALATKRDSTIIR